MDVKHHVYLLTYVDPKQGYNHTKFERPRPKSAHEKANIKSFVISAHRPPLSPLSPLTTRSQK